MHFIFEILMVLSTTPLWLYFLDGYYKKRMRKAVAHVFGFMGAVAISFVCIRWLPFMFVLCAPTVLVLGVVVFSKIARSWPRANR